MDVSPEKRRGTLLRHGVANAVVRASQAKLYEDIVKQQITLDTLKTHRYVLDTDIKIFNANRCSSFESAAYFFRYEEYEELSKYVNMIRTGFCECISCKKAKTQGNEVAGLRLIHALVVNDKNLPLIAYLHKCGCEMNPLTLLKKLSPLQIAVNSQSEKTVKYFVQHFDSIEFAPTLQKALIGSRESANITETLLSSKHVDVNFCSKYGQSLLVSLVERKEDDDIDLIRVFLEAGANLEIADKHGNTPLMIAAKNGCVETVKLLLQHGSIVGSENKIGDTALHLAAFVVRSE